MCVCVGGVINIFAGIWNERKALALLVIFSSVRRFCSKIFVCVGGDRRWWNFVEKDIGCQEMLGQKWREVEEVFLGRREMHWRSGGK